MSPDARGFLDAIALRPVPPESGAGPVDVFMATTQPVPWPKAYGGDLVAQALAAATATVDESRALHSTHAYFLRPADIGEEVRYEVERTRDGGSFSSRLVRGTQHGRDVVECMASFQIPRQSAEYAPRATASLVDPDSLPSSADAVAGHEGPFAEFWAAGRSFELRHEPAPLYFSADPAAAPPASQAIWIRAFSPIPTEPALQRLALAWVCDAPILEPLLRTHGTHWSAPGLMTASLDHSMWFHRDADLNDWLRFALDAESSQSERGLVIGRFTDRGGRLVATVAQEGLLRLP
jgi:acyl-CoA thioesterase-2